jgi:hypothetical protein
MPGVRCWRAARKSPSLTGNVSVATRASCRRRRVLRPRWRPDAVPLGPEIVATREAETPPPDYDIAVVAEPQPLQREEVRVLARSIVVAVGAGQEKKNVTYDKGTVFNARSELCNPLPDAFEAEDGDSQFNRLKAGAGDGRAAARARLRPPATELRLGDARGEEDQDARRARRRADRDHGRQLPRGPRPLGGPPSPGVVLGVRQPRHPVQAGPRPGARARPHELERAAPPHDRQRLAGQECCRPGRPLRRCVCRAPARPRRSSFHEPHGAHPADTDPEWIGRCAAAITEGMASALPGGRRAPPT